VNQDPRCGRCGDPLEVVLGEERIERARQGKNLCEQCEIDVKAEKLIRIIKRS
jgi:hypothetical protein